MSQEHETTRENVLNELSEPSGDFPRELTRWGLDAGDLALIDQMLARTPLERLQDVSRFARNAARLRNARRV